MPSIPPFTKETYKKMKEEQRFTSEIKPKGCDIDTIDDLYFVIHEQKLCMDLAFADFKNHEIRKYGYVSFVSFEFNDGTHGTRPDKSYTYEFCYTCFKKTIPFCKHTFGRSNFSISGCDTYLYLFQNITKVET